MKVPGGRPRRKSPSAEEIAAGKSEGLSFVRLEDMTDQGVREQVQRLFSAGETEHAEELQRYLDAGRPPLEVDRIQAMYQVREDFVPVGEMTHAALLAEASKLKALASAATKPAATAEWKHATQLEQVAAWKLTNPTAFERYFMQSPEDLHVLHDLILKKVARGAPADIKRLIKEHLEGTGTEDGDLDE